jgi:predicted nucleic acid-binding protein
VILLVVDASVAIKWVVQEPGSDAALALRRGRLLAPDLLIPECANILWKKTRLGEHTKAEALVAARLLEHADIELAPMRPLLQRATELSITLGHPAYDCFYLALAEARSCPVVTADERLRKRVQAYGGPARVLGLATAVGDLGLHGTP